MKFFLKKLVNTVRYIIIGIFAIVAIFFLITIGSETTPMLVVEESVLYAEPGGNVTTSDYVNELHVVEQISGANSQGFSHIKYGSSYFRYIDSDNLLDLSSVFGNDDFYTHVVYLKADNNYNGAKALVQLSEISEENPFCGIYIDISGDSNCTEYINVFETFGIPYGYVISYSEFDTIDSMLESLQNFVYPDNSYNVLPTVFDMSGKTFYLSSLSKIEDFMGTDAVFYNAYTATKDNYQHWLLSNESSSDNSYASNVFLIDEATFSYNGFTIDYASFNQESYLYTSYNYYN